MPSADLPLRHVLCLTPTKNGLDSLTRQCVDAICELGAHRAQLAGCSDVALARNILLTDSLHKASDEVTVFLLVDDDMSFSRAQAELVVGECLEREHPVSAIYATSSAALAHTRREDGLWLSGLGFMAVKRSALRSYADTLKLVKAINGIDVYPFCECRAVGDQWYSEDYWFCHAMGGVELLPMSVAHLKKVPLSADAETIDRVMGKPDLPSLGGRSV